MSEKKITKNALTRFAKRNCATWDSPQGICSTTPDGVCLLQMGKNCDYFTKSVFPLCDPSYKFATEQDNYPVLLKLYSKIDSSVTEGDVEVRRCDCGKVLKTRRRLCDKCTRKRRQQAYREYNRKRAG